MKERVLVAMSGGVDSSVAASLLQNEGYDVIGVTMRLFQGPPGGQEGGESDGLRDARSIAHDLGIPHEVVDLQAPFSDLVLEYFVNEYRFGRTPNPCVRCNRFIKFAELVKRADSLGAEWIATGHYARIVYSPEDKAYSLKRALDGEKDQSYFLYLLTQSQLERALLPLGSRTKEQVRDIARRRGMHLHEKPESQEICFIDEKDYRRFFERLDPDFQKPGPIMDPSGSVIGTHRGIVRYTIGQRRGLGIASHRPLYVTRIDHDNNAVHVGPRESVYHQQLLAGNVNWTEGRAPAVSDTMEVRVKIRSIHEPAKGRLHLREDGTVRIHFEEPQWAVTPGQAAVFYREDTCLGGGTILEGS
jgi:tRNA-specific 2-thiouridylase